MATIAQLHEATTTNALPDAAAFIYRLQVAHTLPVIDLDRTPIASLLSPPHHALYLSIMRQQYARFGSLFRLSGVFLLAVLMVPRNIGYYLTIPTLLMALPSLVCGVVMNNSDILRILPQQYEFWFFTILNLINWSCLASFYSDLRILSLVGGVVGTQWVVLIDSNFRTVTSSIRSTSVAAPVLLIIGIAAFFRVIDTDETNYRTIPIAKVNVTLLDVFVNTSVTLAVFVARKGYAKRKVLITQAATLQTIRCVVFRSKFQLKKADALEETRTGTRTIVTNALEVQSFPNACRRTPVTETMAHQQQVTLVAMKLKAVDVRHVLAPHLAPLYAPLSPVRGFLVYATGIVGFTTTVFTLTRRSAGSSLSPPTTVEYTLAITALLSTLAFFLTCATSFHRSLANALVHNFDFLFSSIQFTLAMLLISDMVQWDFRSFGTFAWLLWFHCVLFLDALTPPLKNHLRIRKVYFLPVVAASLVGIVCIIYGFFFSNVAEYFVERTLWETRFHGRTIALRTKSLLMNRLFTVLLWSCRLLWEVAVCPDDELMFIRGNLDYFTSMEMIPPLQGGGGGRPVQSFPKGGATTQSRGRRGRCCTGAQAVHAEG